jgi:hypothetical protein
MAMTDPIAWVRSFWIPRQEVRAEIWALSGRHQGRVMEGAKLEAKSPGISGRRAVLLQAVMRRHAGSAAALAERDRTHMQKEAP